MLKKAMAFFVVCTMAICIPCTAFAEEKTSTEVGDQVTIIMTASTGEVTQHVIDIENCTRVETDANGNILPQTKGTTSVNMHNVAQGSTMTYYSTTGSSFYIASGTYVTFSLNLSASGAYRMGYKNSSGTQYQKYSGSSSSSPSFSTTISSTGNYTFYFTNASASSVTVYSGSISF
jgi:hypothetical protein